MTPLDPAVLQGISFTLHSGVTWETRCKNAVWPRGDLLKAAWPRGPGAWSGHPAGAVRSPPWTRPGKLLDEAAPVTEPCGSWRTRRSPSWGMSPWSTRSPARTYHRFHSLEPAGSV